mgnify:CR=1 FL=1
MKVLEARNIKKYYGKEPNITKALDGVDFNVEKGEFVAIVGTSGSGKSTLLNMLGGLDIPTSGEIKIQGKKLSDLNDEQLTIFRRRNIGFIFQNYNLLPMLNVYENIVLPIELDGQEVDQTFLNEIINMLGLQEKLKSMPNMLSGGQQQRVALARSIVFSPDVLMLDEPLAALDKQLRKQMQLEIKAIHNKFGLTTISVTHDQEEALTMATKVCVMKEAKIQQIDTPEMIYDCPVNTFVANFIGESTVIPATIRGIREGKITAVFDKDDRLFEVDCKRRDYWAGLNKKVNFIIRPEKVKIVKEDYDGIKFPARITSCAFLGDTFRVNVITDSGIEFKMKVFSRGHYDLSVGNRLWVGVRPYDMVLVRYDDEI